MTKCQEEMIEKKLPFTRTIRKSASSMLSAALQLFLLIKWRSLRTLLRSDFRASTESERRRVRVNCKKKSQFIVDKTGETDYYTHKHSKQIGLKKRRIYAQFRQHRIFTEPNDL